MNKQSTTLPDGIVTPLPIPRELFSLIAIDFGGPFPSDNKKELILVVLDCFTGFTYLIPVSQNITAVKTANRLIERIFSVHRFPTSIVSDRDPKFTSRFWMQFMANIKIDLNMATAYHHQTNGKTERRIKTIRQCLQNCVNPKETKGFTTFHMFKQLSTLPLEIHLSYLPFKWPMDELSTSSLVLKFFLQHFPLLMT